MAEKLKKTEIMRRQLNGDVNHELRTPLTAMKGFLEGLMDGVLTANLEIYQQIHSEIDRLQRLVNDLQELSRVEDGASQLQIEPEAPATLIDIIQNNLGLQFELKNIKLLILVEPGLPLLLVDKDRIIQVLTNLVGNPLLYTPNGGTIIIQIRREKSNVVFIVKDNGIGIQTEQLAYIINRFYRTDKSRTKSNGGSGIGLTIARAIVQSHQGKIRAESNGEGQGSTISFQIPIPKEP